MDVSMAQSGQHCCLLLAPVSDETPDSPRLTLEKTSCSESAAKTARNNNRGFLRDTVVKTFGRLYNEFLPTKRSNVQENGVREAHEVPTRQGARLVWVGAPSTLVEASCPSRTTSYFPIFLNILKGRKKCY